MKTTLSSLLSLLALGALAPQANAQTNDRFEASPGRFAITHTENFEYVCRFDLGSTNSNGKPEFVPLYLDINFSAAQPYRVAVGFAGGARVGTMVGAEAIVKSAVRARKPELDLKLEIDDQDSGPGTIHFVEAAKKITATFTTRGGTETAACEKNEPI